MIKNIKDLKLAVIGLGYVGLPLALSFGKKRKVIGYDINKERIEELKFFKDKNLEYSANDIRLSKKLILTKDESDLKFANCYIISVPTPVNRLNKPDLSLLLKASKTISKNLKKNDLVIYESTVFPGCTEEVCVPILEKFSNLKYNKDFFCGYSPERINPGDKYNTIENIKKVTSGSTNEVAKIVDKLYNEIIKVGTHLAPSIKVAEAAKIIENTQRDLNISLINELSILFKKLNIDTQEVLDAAESKWNFLSFKPGLVGGHCIGVDPYYLTYKAQKIGYKPKVILAGRKINDSMGNYIVSEIQKILLKKKIKIKNSRVLIMGFSFKENCSDYRNSKVIDVVRGLENLKAKVDVFDPVVDQKKIRNEYKINILNSSLKGFLQKKINTSRLYDVLVLAVNHDFFKKIPIKILHSICKKNHVIYDLKWLLKKNQSDLRL